MYTFYFYIKTFNRNVLVKSIITVPNQYFMMYGNEKYILKKQLYDIVYTIKIFIKIHNVFSHTIHTSRNMNKFLVFMIVGFWNKKKIQKRSNRIHKWYFTYFYLRLKDFWKIIKKAHDKMHSLCVYSDSIQLKQILRYIIGSFYGKPNL